VFFQVSNANLTGRQTNQVNHYLKVC